ncbi:TPA: hypothetical protein DCW61_00320 [Candidatus Uhrbacteria bacterium]|nr:hypothetical protein [Candidatus Uhrbacteria bacterium]
MYKPSLYEAIKGIGDGIVLISRVPLERVFAQIPKISCGAFDFDGTLISGSQWQALSVLMNADLRAQDSRNRDWYWSQTHGEFGSDQMTLENPDWFHGVLLPENQQVVEGAWISESIRLYQEAELTRKQIRETACTLSTRPGVYELFQKLDQRVVISFGIEQIIQDWLEHMNLNPTAVAASRLKFDEQERVNGCHINLVASHTKKCAVERFKQVGKIDERNLLVVGDSVVDVHMMGKNSFNVLIVPPSELDRRLADFREGNLLTMWDRITLILASDSLVPLLNLLKALEA